MKELLVSILLALPACSYAQDLTKASLETMPGPDNIKAEAADSELAARPDAQKIMSELSATLHLSSKQEERLSSAINKKTSEFDKQMKEYDKNSAEEKKWRYKMNENRHSMALINRNMPDVIREFLDDDQRQNYDGMLEAGKKPAVTAVEPAQTAGDAGAAKPLKKRRLVRRKKIPAADTESAGPAEDEAGQVMVDKEQGAAQPGLKKRRVLKKKTRQPAPAEDLGPAEPAGAKPTGQEAAPAQEDAGSYP